MQIDNPGGEGRDVGEVRPDQPVSKVKSGCRSRGRRRGHGQGQVRGRGERQTEEGRQT